MKNRKETKENISIDPHLDTPTEANREKHINFLEVEEGSGRSGNDNVDDFAKERRKEWEKGIAEGKEAHDKNE